MSPSGPCSLPIAVDRTRSVSLETDIWSENRKGNILSQMFGNPFAIILTICFSAVILFAIIFSILQFTNRSERRAHNLNEYQKVSTSSSIQFEKMSHLMADEDEEEDSLFEKT